MRKKSQANCQGDEEGLTESKISHRLKQSKNGLVVKTQPPNVERIALKQSASG